MTSTTPLMNHAKTRTAIPSDTFSVGDLLLWNPFHQQIRRTGAASTDRNAAKKADDNDDDSCDDLNVKYDNHWILILNGSYRGYFDWIPIHLRTGEWSVMATLYFRTSVVVSIHCTDRM